MNLLIAMHEDVAGQPAGLSTGQGVEISVVVPLYNKAGYVKRAIESVLAQSYPCKELVVVDDGSTDNSVEELSGVENSRIRIVNQRNQGPGAARNRGARETTAEWIALLDADDWWAPTHLETAAALIRGFRNIAVAAKGYQSSGPSGLSKTFDFAGHGAEPWCGDCDAWFRAAVEGHPVFWSSAVVVRKDVWMAVGGFREDMAFGEDTDMWMRLVQDHAFAFSRDVTAFYWQEGEDAGTASTHRRGIDGFSAPHFTEWPEKYGRLGEWQAEFIARRQMELLGGLCREGFGAEVRRYVKQIDTSRQKRKKQLLWLKSWLPPRLLFGISTAKQWALRQACGRISKPVRAVD